MTPDEIAALPYRPCVGVMLINGEGLIFAGQRLDNEIPAWQMPQGGIDEGEDPRAAALRELWEETGIPAERAELLDETEEWLTYDLPALLVPNVWRGRYRGQKQRWFLMRYNGRDEDIDIATEHPEFSSWCWLTAEALLDSIVPFKRDIYATLIERFRPHLR